MKKGLIILCIILLFIPTYISVIYYVSMQDTPIVSRNVDKIEIEAPDGKTVSSDEDESLITLFSDISNNRGSKTEFPSSYESKPHYTVSYYSYGAKTDLRFYFTSDPSACYFLDGDDVCYRVPSSYAAQFLKMPISEAVYPSAIPPVMTIGPNTVEPQTLTWKYMPYGATEFADSTRSVSGGYAITEVGSISSNFSYVFDIEPTTVDVVVSDVTDPSRVLYSGSFAGLAGSITVTESVKVNMSFSVTWDAAAYQGSGNYVVSGTIYAPAEFTISATEALCGQFVVIKGINVLDINDIEFSSSPSINFVPTFFDLGNGEVAALVPIDIDLGNENCNYTISIRSGDSISDLALVVKARDQGNTNKIYNAATTIGSIDLATNAYKNIYANIKTDIANYTDYSKLYHTSKFAPGFSTSITRSSFGTYSRYSGFNETDYLNYDYHYAGAGKVTAMADGKVIYIGSQPYTGKVMVIDHGYGLLTWYCNLGEVNAIVGAEIRQGETIGSNVNGNGVCQLYNGSCSSIHIAATIFGVPIDTTQLMENGLPALK